MAVVFTACESSLEENTVQAIDAVQLQKQLVRADDYADSVRSWYFTVASPQERYNYWLWKVELDLSYMQLNSDQCEFVLEIFDQLSPQDFNVEVEPSKAFSNWVLNWLDRADSFQLSRNQMGQFVFSLSPAPMGPSAGLSYVDQCNCSTESDWCDFLNGGPSSECSAYCDLEMSSGCGALFLYKCDKDCTF